MFFQIGLLLIVVFNIFQVTNGTGNVEIMFLQFENPTGTTGTGECCDGFRPFCMSSCDHRFSICLDNAFSNNDIQNCPYGSQDTGEITDKDQIYFSSLIGNVSNPLNFNFNAWPGAIRIKVDVWDMDENAHDHVDFMHTVITATPSPNHTHAIRAPIRLRGRSILDIAVRIFCDENYYGPNCDQHCHRRDDVTGHYTCHPKVGQRVCNNGWQGQLCDVDVNECSVSNPCANGGTCINTLGGFRCSCRQRFTGVNCETALGSCRQNFCHNGGTCYIINSTVTCNCPVHWNGELCNERVTVCMENPCENNASCSVTGSGPVCACTDGWSGNTCNITTNNRMDTNVTTSTPKPVTTARPNIPQEPIKIYLEGEVTNNNEEQLIQGLKELIGDYSDVKEDYLLQIEKRYFRGENGELVTELMVSVVSADSENNTQISDIFSQKATDVLKNYLPLPLYGGAVTEIPRPLEEMSWVEENWYILLVISVAVILIIISVVIYTAVQRHRRQERRRNFLARNSTNIQASEMDQEFQNHLYLEMHSGTPNGVDTNNIHKTSNGT
ncbi:hypothetical protein ScPMuIL_007427 [Solemya velum]